MNRFYTFIFSNLLLLPVFSQDLSFHYTSHQWQNFEVKPNNDLERITQTSQYILLFFHTPKFRKLIVYDKKTNKLFWEHKIEKTMRIDLIEEDKIFLSDNENILKINISNKNVEILGKVDFKYLGDYIFLSYLKNKKTMLATSLNVEGTALYQLRKTITRQWFNPNLGMILCILEEQGIVVAFLSTSKIKNGKVLKYSYMNSICAYSLSTGEIIWQKKFSDYIIHYSQTQNDNLIIVQGNKCIIIDIRTGIVITKYYSKNKSEISSLLTLDSDNFFISSVSNDLTKILDLHLEKKLIVKTIFPIQHMELSKNKLLCGYGNKLFFYNIDDGSLLSFFNRGSRKIRVRSNFYDSTLYYSRFEKNDKISISKLSFTGNQYELENILIIEKDGTVITTGIDIGRSKDGVFLPQIPKGQFKFSIKIHNSFFYK